MGEVLHVLNRAVARLMIFARPHDYEAFIRVLDETRQIVPLPIFAMVAKPNHWHFVVLPVASDQVSGFFRRLAGMYTTRCHAHDKTGGTGHLYQEPLPTHADAQGHSRASKTSSTSLVFASACSTSPDRLPACDAILSRGY